MVYIVRPYSAAGHISFPNTALHTPQLLSLSSTLRKPECKQPLFQTLHCNETRMQTISVPNTALHTPQLLSLKSTPSRNQNANTKEGEHSRARRPKRRLHIKNAGRKQILPGGKYFIAHGEQACFIGIAPSLNDPNISARIGALVEPQTVRLVQFHLKNLRRSHSLLRRGAWSQFTHLMTHFLHKCSTLSQPARMDKAHEAGLEDTTRGPHNHGLCTVKRSGGNAAAAAGDAAAWSHLNCHTRHSCCTEQLASGPLPQRIGPTYVALRAVARAPPRADRSCNSSAAEWGFWQNPCPTRQHSFRPAEWNRRRKELLVVPSIRYTVLWCKLSAQADHHISRISGSHEWGLFRPWVGLTHPKKNQKGTLV